MKSECLVLSVVALLAVAAGRSGATGATGAGGGAGASGPNGGGDPEALVRRVATAYAGEMHGVVGLRTRTELVIDGPLYHRRTPSDPWYVYDDGALVRSSEAQDARRPLVHDALRPAYLPEYHFAFTACTDCEASEVAVAYDSPQHDTYHAHGYFVIDAATERVLRSVEIPYELPWPTTEGRLEVVWGSTGNAWLPLSVAGTFSGKFGPMRGRARYTQQLSPYEHYPRVETAVDALTAQTGATPAPQPTGAQGCSSSKGTV